MSFLAALAARLVEWAAEKGVALFSVWIKHQEQQIKIEHDAQKLKEQLESAKTPDEKSSAADSVSRNSFN